MNINELFFYKTIPCNKKKEHDFEQCYYNHYYFKSPIQDTRRLIIGFKIMNRIDSYQDDEIIFKNEFQYYTNDIGFESDALNSEIFEEIPCKNTYEYKFHILNYKKNE
jgi:hypothetical protein